MRENDVSVARRGKVGDRAQVQLVAPQRHGGLPDGHAVRVGDRDLLGAQTFSHTHLPTVSHLGTGRGRLRQNASSGNGGGVELVFDVEVEAGVQGRLAGLAHGHAGEVGDRDLAAMQCDAESERRGKHRNDDHGQGSGSNAEESLHRGFQDSKGARLANRERGIGVKP